MSIKLLIADDHEVVRAGLRSLLAGTDDSHGRRGDDRRTSHWLVVKHEPDVVLMDIRMPEGDGLTGPGPHQAR